MIPNNLQEPLRQARADIPQEKSPPLLAPRGVKVRFRRGHRHCFSADAFAKSSLRKARTPGLAANLNGAALFLSSELCVF